MTDILVRAGCFVAIIILGIVLRRTGFFKREDFDLLSRIVILKAVELCGDIGKGGLMVTEEHDDSFLIRLLKILDKALEGCIGIIDGGEILSDTRILIHSLDLNAVVKADG